MSRSWPECRGTWPGSYFLKIECHGTDIPGFGFKDTGLQMEFIQNECHSACSPWNVHYSTAFRQEISFLSVLVSANALWH